MPFRAARWCAALWVAVLACPVPAQNFRDFTLASEYRYSLGRAGIERPWVGLHLREVVSRPRFGLYADLREDGPDGAPAGDFLLPSLGETPRGVLWNYKGVTRVDGTAGWSAFGRVGPLRFLTDLENDYATTLRLGSRIPGQPRLPGVIHLGLEYRF